MDLQSFKLRLKKFFRRLLILLIVIGIGLFCFLYWGTFSTGVRSGIVVKISKKGLLLKTFEGQLNLETFGALKSNVISESFEFSVERSEDNVLKVLEEASLSGERVSLHYVERFAKFPWRGETKYFIVKVDQRPQTGSQ